MEHKKDIVNLSDYVNNEECKEIVEWFDKYGMLINGARERFVILLTYISQLENSTQQTTPKETTKLITELKEFINNVNSHKPYSTANALINIMLLEQHYSTQQSDTSAEVTIENQQTTPKELELDIITRANELSRQHRLATSTLQLSEDVEDMIRNIEHSGYYFEWEGLDTQNKYECGKYQLVGDYTWELLKQHIQALEEYRNHYLTLRKNYDEVTLPTLQAQANENQQLQDKLDKISTIMDKTLINDKITVEDAESILSILKG